VENTELQRVTPRLHGSAVVAPSKDEMKGNRVSTQHLSMERRKGGEGVMRDGRNRPRGTLLKPTVKEGSDVAIKGRLEESPRNVCVFIERVNPL